MTIDENAVAPHPLRWLWLVGAALGVFAVGLGSTGLGAAVPTIARDLALPLSQLRWIIAGPALMFAVLVVPAAAGGRLLGPVRVYLLGAFFLVVAGVVAATAHSGIVLEFARLGQGVGAALLVPQAVVYALAYLGRVERALVCGLFAVAFVGGSAVGPLVGSTLVQHTSWRAVLWLAVGLAVVAGLAGAPLVAQRLPIRPDLRALLVALVALPAFAAIMLPLVGRDTSDWSAWSYASVSVGALLFAVALVIEATRLGVRTGVGAPILAVLALAGSTHIALLSVYLQVIGRHPATTISYLGLPSALGALLGAALAVVIGLWLDQRFAAVGGVAFIALGALLSLVSLGSAGLVTVGADEAMTGFGLGLVVTVLARQADTALVFAALSVGTATGGAIASVLADSTAAGSLPDALRDGVTRVLIGALVLLAGAVAVALVLPSTSLDRSRPGWSGR
jgi:MFS family permease